MPLKRKKQKKKLPDVSQEHPLPFLYRNTAEPIPAKYMGMLKFN
jgi:hypothetical protein